MKGATMLEHDWNADTRCVTWSLTFFCYEKK